MLKWVFRRYFVYLCFIFGFGSSVLNAAPKKASRAVRAAEANHYSVRIVSKTSQLLVPEVVGASGTGFIYSLSETEGIVFTNRHVIDREQREAQEISLQFNCEKGVPETLRAEIVHESHLYDFAVLKFDPSKLKRANGLLTVAPMASGKKFFDLIQSGEDVMAFGNPYGLSNNATFGAISNRDFGSDWDISAQMFWGEETFIRTDAALILETLGDLWCIFEAEWSLELTLPEWIMLTVWDLRHLFFLSLKSGKLTNLQDLVDPSITFELHSLSIASISLI